jgi:hypothetical protein
MEEKKEVLGKGKSTAKVSGSVTVYKGLNEEEAAAGSEMSP